ncbi:hypothetical protein L195_g061833 [Trifolium pratense]|uniref:Uncharacterized protein n=1 Tax=Trifolium pratense TaxID=57577 RepID=A0A2K3KC57_TRIPR|nr:hypothetical protein L195_g061833 [Trifolium pratense]
MRGTVVVPRGERARRGRGDGACNDGALPQLLLQRKKRKNGRDGRDGGGTTRGADENGESDMLNG